MYVSNEFYNTIVDISTHIIDSLLYKVPKRKHSASPEIFERNAAERSDTHIVTYPFASEL